MRELDWIAWAFSGHDSSMTLALSMSRPENLKLTHYQASPPNARERMVGAQKLFLGGTIYVAA